MKHGVTVEDDTLTVAVTRGAMAEVGYWKTLISLLHFRS